MCTLLYNRTGCCRSGYTVIGWCFSLRTLLHDRTGRHCSGHAFFGPFCWSLERRKQPTASTLTLWWLKNGPTGGGVQGNPPSSRPRMKIKPTPSKQGPTLAYHRRRTKRPTRRKPKWLHNLFHVKTRETPKPLSYRRSVEISMPSPQSKGQHLHCYSNPWGNRKLARNTALN